MYLSLSKPIDGNKLKGLIVSVNHANYGTLFAAMVKGSGSLISQEDENGVPLPFLSTEQVLKQLEKFGFIIKYDLKSNLPDQVIAYLSTLYNIGYDKINVVGMRTLGDDKYSYIIKNRVIVLKSCDETVNFMKYGRICSESTFNKMMATNLAVNVTDEPDMVWDWVTQLFNISDILDENIDPTDDFETQTDIESSKDEKEFEAAPYLAIDNASTAPEGYSIYTGEGSKETLSDGEVTNGSSIG